MNSTLIPPEFIETEEADGRERILRAAYTLFVAAGYQSVSMQHIADEAGVQKATLYHHFRSKDELFAAIVRAVNAQVQREVEAVIALGGSAAEQLTRIACQSFARSRSDVSRMMTDVHENLGPDLRKQLLKEKTFPWELLEEIVRTAMRDGELPEMDVDLVISMYTGLIWGQLWMAKIGRTDRTFDGDLARTLVETLFAGLRANARCSEFRVPGSA
ncbi:MAG: TetR/AcrR family transcriptional regulator [Thermomicrobiales bacterium]|nr:TetR/AcrR family transcriptional regulator [Thermomicrobiales bacterium]